MKTTRYFQYTRKRPDRAIEADVVKLTEEEKKVIDERLKAYHQNPNLRSLWQDVFKRIVSKK